MDLFRVNIKALRHILTDLPFIQTRKRLRWLVLGGCSIFGFIAAWIGSQFQGMPEPISMLDHARLLAAETLASGKFSSPPSSGSFFLQTHLTLQSPAYAAALHPGESLLLALGTLWGEPVYGLWLGSAIFSLSIAWAIAGFASLRWCILGSIFGTLCYTFLCSWGQSFSGDINTAIGVALAWGAVRRYASTPTTRHTALLFIGLGFAFLCNPVAALLFAPIPLWIWFSTWKRQNFVKTHLATAVVLVAAAMTIQGVHNHATTGICFPAQSVYILKNTPTILISYGNNLGFLRHSISPTWNNTMFL